MSYDVAIYCYHFNVERARRGRGDGLEVFVDFIHNKYGELPDLDMITLIVSFTCGKHWSVYVLGDYGYFHFDSMVIAGLYANLIKHVLFAKL